MSVVEVQVVSVDMGIEVSADWASFDSLIGEEVDSWFIGAAKKYAQYGLTHFIH